MFHRSSKKFAAIVVALGLSLLPATSFAESSNPQVEATQVQAQVNTSAMKDKTFRDIRNGTEEKLFEAKAWAKEQKAPQEIKYFIDDMEKATDRLQDEVSPIGHSIKSFAGKSLPGTSLAQSGDKSFTVYGMLLMMALVFVFTMMNLASPESRLGGRH